MSQNSYCKKCGQTITQHQVEHFKGLCPECQRSQSSSKNFNATLAVGFGIVAIVLFVAGLSLSNGDLFGALFLSFMPVISSLINILAYKDII
ncbi:MAG: hypothetical protein ACFE9L_00215 [Candidatus Hodarchaeota archaeon]